MKTGIAILLYCLCTLARAQLAPAGQPPESSAYPETEARAAWHALSASYVRKAVKDQKLDRDQGLNARVDAVMARIGAALAAGDPRFAAARWKAILIEEFGYGAVAFPDQTILVDSRFVRRLDLDDDELAMILAHEVAHVAAGHAYAKLAFMAEILGKDKAPNARTALLEFLATDAYAEAFQPIALQQEREADRIGAGIFAAAGYDARRGLSLFDKLALREVRTANDSHDPAATRKQQVTAVLAGLPACPGQQAPSPGTATRRCRSADAAKPAPG